ncbi:5'-3' exonuclease [Phocicoccus pinnipedialis]|uniref:5'-3' exonuclease n=1 Tax=Phocicoccus pinnipedialis TaxID=110845 RepID=A0A6V7RD95_9BACL|nr:5'-3' exonuclease [Jeotgalicoccus pinnipedialis]MBP1939395.1 5'-3' exonuclease [Jeotgalicoccus pinnipedialis]CAD2075535.1 5'-3' exonuclease [Jeotgalicoccus pinnipedialis]
MSKLLVIDGMALLFRHFFATSFRNHFMYNSNNIPTNGIQGTIRHIYKIIEMDKPTNVIVTWDMSSKTVRNEWFSNYKIDRPAPPEELRPQFDYVKEVLAELGFFQIGVTGYEADDIIGTLAKHHDNITIVSGDRDLLQVLAPGVKLWLTKKGYTEYNKYTEERFIEEYGVTPEQFIDVKALMGDSGDGYFGVKGIGEKTALNLIKKHGSIEKLLENLDTCTPSQKRNIENDMEHLLMSQKLARIITDVPFNIEEALTLSPFRYDEKLTMDVLNEHDLTISRKYIERLEL